MLHLYVYGANTAPKPVRIEMTDIEKQMAQQLINACEALMARSTAKDIKVVRDALDLAKAHYGKAGDA
jgi:aspartyl/asparaginyl beta-hydroxylase (cupin superfamily)